MTYICTVCHLHVFVSPRVIAYDRRERSAVGRRRMWDVRLEQPIQPGTDPLLRSRPWPWISLCLPVGLTPGEFFSLDYWYLRTRRSLYEGPFVPCVSYYEGTFVRKKYLVPSKVPSTVLINLRISCVAPGLEKGLEGDFYDGRPVSLCDRMKMQGSCMRQWRCDAHNGNSGLSR